MAVRYKRLWELLIDKDMKKKDLCAVAGISQVSVAKLGEMKILPSMCWLRYVLHCSVTLAILWS